MIKPVIIFLSLVFFPIGVSAARYWAEEPRGGWQTADRSSARLLPEASRHPEAIIRIYGARTLRWKAIFAIHTWIVVKEANASTYTRYDYTAWGEPIRLNGFEPDGRWFGRVPEVIFAADGEAAAALIPEMQAAVAGYAWRNHGDYRPWPGPNSNTFVAWMARTVPELQVDLPATAVGKDYLGSKFVSTAPSGTGFQFTLAGLLGVAAGPVEGFELNVLGLNFGVSSSGVKLPIAGRVGLPRFSAPAKP